MLSGAGRTLSWDPDHRLASVTMQAGGTATFAYDHTGTRVRKTTDSGVMRYPFAGYEVDHTGFITKHILAGDERVAVKRADGQKLFYHSDHLGGVHVITNQSGERVQLVEYDPWGKVTRQDGSADLTHRFTGEDFDPETGLLYFGGRYYDPALARFTIPDPYIPRPSDPQAFNRYAYARNNPVNRIDPSGYEDADADDGESNSPPGPEDPPTLDPDNFSLSIPLGLIGPEFSVRGLTITYYADSPAAAGPAVGPSPALAGAAVGTDPAGGEDPGAGTRLAMAGAATAVRVAVPYLVPAARAAGAAISAALGGLLGSATSNTGQQPGSAPSSSSDSLSSNKGDSAAGQQGSKGAHSTPASPPPPDPNEPTPVDPQDTKHLNKLSNQLIRQMEKHEPGIVHQIKKGLPHSDIYMDKHGNLFTVPKGGGEGQPTGLNINMFR